MSGLGLTGTLSYTACTQATCSQTPASTGAALKQSSFLLLIFVSLSITYACHGARREGSLELGQVWAHMESEWHDAPPEAEVLEATAWAELATFRPGGEFIWINCMLIKQGRITRVSQGDPVVVYRGRWKTTASGIKVEYRLVFRTVQIAGKGLPGSLEVARVTQMGKALIFHDRQFIPLKGFEKNSFYSMITSPSGE
jgi:hypothetical protein